MDVEEKEEVQAKGIDNIFNKMSENFLNLEKQRVRQVLEAFRTPNTPDQKKNKFPKMYYK
jgi:hypothetical protein